MSEHAMDEHLSLGEIGLLIVTTATRNVALTGRRTAELRRTPGWRARQAQDATTPGSH
ncbi:hypothetical protein AB0I66_03115 [Streptomyces sp. NPDC050439]|uniref:hypothetical protein n=1 Tax=unclassified Streptomyces TaxID=2593676 RepID=UPI00341B0C75